MNGPSASPVLRGPAVSALLAVVLAMPTWAQASPAENDAKPVEEIDAAVETESKVEEPAGRKAIEDRVVDILRTVYDPEIPVNVYELGLVYKIDVS